MLKELFFSPSAICPTPYEALLEKASLRSLGCGAAGAVISRATLPRAPRFLYRIGVKGTPPSLA